MNFGNLDFWTKFDRKNRGHLKFTGFSAKSTEIQQTAEIQSMAALQPNTENQQFLLNNSKLWNESILYSNSAFDGISAYYRNSAKLTEIRLKTVQPPTTENQ